MKQSEKVIEKELSRRVEKLGGWSLKMLSVHVSGLPDRLCLFPGGAVFFAELKSTGETPTKIQLFQHRKLRSLGFRVEVLDSSKDIKSVLADYGE